MNSNEPVAWAVIEADGTLISVHDNAIHAAFVIEELAYDGMEAVPLYRSPLLTDEERAVIEVCATHWQTAPASDVLRRLLDRTKVRS